jgi:C-terminal processing protease CtpA/Prc
LVLQCGHRIFRFRSNISTTDAACAGAAVQSVGETTEGVFSDVLGRKLPNGWRFWLPNERFVTAGKTYDIVGIAPDVRVESLTPAARATGKDAAIEKALEILRASR